MAWSEKMASAASPSENTENVMKKDMTAKADDNIVVLFPQPAAALAQQTLLQIWLRV